MSDSYTYSMGEVEVLIVRPLSPCRVQLMGEDEWMGLEDFDFVVDYRTPIGGHICHKHYTIPAGFKSDFASIPRLFQRAVPKGRSERVPSYIHDFLCRKAICIEEREYADRVFLIALKGFSLPCPPMGWDSEDPIRGEWFVDLSNSWIRRNVMFLAVQARTKRYKYFNKEKVN